MKKNRLGSPSERRYGRVMEKKDYKETRRNGYENEKKKDEKNLLKRKD